MNTREVANRLVTLCRQGEFSKAMDELYSPDIHSIEPESANLQNAKGMEAVRKKEEEFNSMIEEYHGVEVSEPLIAGHYFTVHMNMDATIKGHGRTHMEELCVYQVKNGKIVREQFFYEEG